jgi:Plavaka transposase
MLSTDKTLLSQHRGDQSGWPVYVMIGNHSARLRYKHEQPTKICIGLLPIPKFPKGTSAAASKMTLYHRCMEEIFECEYSFPQYSDHVETILILDYSYIGQTGKGGYVDRLC